MPPKIALLICVIFILYLFKIDSSWKSNVSRALWIPLIWMMIIGSKMVSLWLNSRGAMASPEAYLKGSPIDRAIFAVLIVVGLFILYRRKIYWSPILKNNVWILLFFLYGGISILWSDFPFVSFKRWIKAIGNPIMVLIVLTDPAPVEAVKKMFRRCAYVLIPLSILFIKYFPSLGRSYNRYSGDLFVTGVTTSKNGLGVLCLVLGFFFFWNLLTLWRNKNISVDKKEIYIQVFFLLMILWLLIRAHSATSLMCFIIGICFLIIVGLPSIRRNVSSIGIYLLIAFFTYWILELSIDITRVLIESLGRDMTLTTRTYIWKELLNMGTNPLIGTGYESFWLGDRLTRIWTEVKMGLNEAHNGYLEIYLNLGLVGLFLLIGVVVSSYRSIHRTLMSDFDYGSFKMGFLVIVLVYNVTEASFRGLYLLWFIFLLIAMDVPRASQLQISDK